LVLLVLCLPLFSTLDQKKNECRVTRYQAILLFEGLHKSLDGLKLQYKDASQERITVTKLAFWNAGRETIDTRDLVVTDPIGIACPSTLAILDIQVIQVSSKSNSVKLGSAIDKDDVHFYPINFEYLDNKDFFVIQIVHSGHESEEFNIKGKIKGVKKIEKARGIRLNRRELGFGFLENMLTSRAFLKYGGSLTYLGFGAFGTWNLLQGRTDWYVWTPTVFCFFAASIIYYGMRHIAPVKI